jgi:hypothetical protein
MAEKRDASTAAREGAIADTHFHHLEFLLPSDVRLLIWRMKLASIQAKWY